MSADPYADLCADPAYSGTRFCRLRAPGETPDEFTERDAYGGVDGGGLAVTVKHGNSPWPLAIAFGVLAALAFYKGGARG